MILFLINSLSTARQAAQGGIAVDGPTSFFATEKWGAKDVLERAGLRAQILDQYVSIDECRSLNRTALEICQQWHFDEGRDVTVLDGISLGELAYYDVRNEIIHTLKIAGFFEQALADLKPTELVTDWPPSHPGFPILDEISRSQGIPLRIIPAEPTVRLGTEILPRTSPLSLSKNLILRILNLIADASNAVRRRKRKKVLGVTYIVMNPVYRAWNRSTARFQWLLSPLPPPGKWEWVKLAFQGAKTLPAPLSQHLPEPAQRRLSDIQTEWNSLKKQVEYRSRFQYRGIRFFAGLECTFDRVINREIAFYAPFVRHFLRVLETDPPKAALVPSEGPWEMRLFVLICRKLGVPVISLQHGYYNRTQSSAQRMEMNQVDYAFVWSPETIQNYLSGGQDLKGASAVGNPNFDAYGDTDQYSHPPKPGSPFIILALCNTFSPTGTEHSTAGPEEHALALYQAFSRLRFPYRVILRAYNQDELNHYRFLAERFPAVPTEYSHARNSPFDEPLRRCDVVIAEVTTGLFQAWYLNKPFIFFNVSRIRYSAPFDFKSDILSADSPDRLVELLEKIQAGRLTQPPWESKKALEKYVGCANGRTSLRVVTEMDNLLARLPDHAKN